MHCLLSNISKDSNFPWEQFWTEKKKSAHLHHRSQTDREADELKQPRISVALKKLLNMIKENSTLYGIPHEIADGIWVLGSPVENVNFSKTSSQRQWLKSKNMATWSFQVRRQAISTLVVQILYSTKKWSTSSVQTFWQLQFTPEIETHGIAICVQTSVTLHQNSWQQSQTARQSPDMHSPHPPWLQKKSD